MIREPADNVYRQMKITVIVLVFFAFVLAGCGYMTPAAYIRLPTYTVTPTLTSVPTMIPRATYTLTPKMTPDPIGTVSETEAVSPMPSTGPTQTVTPTLIPGALDCNLINSNHINGITDLQWAAYAETVMDKRVYFSGSVHNVEVDGVVDLIDPNQQCNFRVYNIPLKQAIKINKDQFIEGYGAITSIDFTDVVVIHLNVLLDSLIIR